MASKVTNLPQKIDRYSREGNLSLRSRRIRIPKRHVQLLVLEIVYRLACDNSLCGADLNLFLSLGPQTGENIWNHCKGISRCVLDNLKRQKSLGERVSDVHSELNTGKCEAKIRHFQGKRVNK